LKSLSLPIRRPALSYGFSAFHKPSFLNQIDEVIRLSIVHYS